MAASKILRYPGGVARFGSIGDIHAEGRVRFYQFAMTDGSVAATQRVSLS